MEGSEVCLSAENHFVLIYLLPYYPLNTSFPYSDIKTKIEHDRIEEKLFGTWPKRPFDLSESVLSNILQF